MKYITLGEICKKGSSNIAQKDLEGNVGDYEIYGASGFIKKVDFYHQEKPYIAIVKDGAGVGRTMLLPAKSSVIGTMQYILPNDDIDIRYLYYAISNMNLGKYYMGAAIPHIYFKDYQSERLPAREIDEQKHIADILTKTDALISNRRAQLIKLDELVKSRFIELFGDPIRNEKDWQIVPLSSCLKSIDSGKSFVCDSVARKGNWPAVLKLSAATYGDYRPEENKAMLDRNQFIKDAAVCDGDLLFTRKNTPELVGMCAYVYETPHYLMMPDLIFRLNTKECCNKIFLWKLINLDLFRGVIQSVSSGSAKSMSNISKERLLGVNIILPPIDLQNEFANFVEQTDKLKFDTKQALEKLEILKKSLMQQYFG